MFREFNDVLLSQWCGLYVRYVIEDKQRLAALVRGCPAKELQRYLFGKTNIEPLLTPTPKTDEDYLTAYGILQELDNYFWQKRHPSLLNGYIEKSFDGRRYILTYLWESPIVKAIPEDQRFRQDSRLGNDKTLAFRYHWQQIERSAEVEICRSDILDIFTPDHNFIKVGFSPIAGMKDMSWNHDPEDIRADGRVPFWCSGAKDEMELLGRLNDVLQIAHEQQIHVLLFPELVMTKNLQQALSEWLNRPENLGD